MTKPVKIISLLLISALIWFSCSSKEDYTKYVNQKIGSGKHGKITPAVVVPFGMLQCGPNTREGDVGYNYYDKWIKGFSLVNKRGSGCSDLHDILFVPVSGDQWDTIHKVYPREGFPLEFSHDNEIAKPGYYQVKFEDITTEITATPHCALQRYTYARPGENHMAIDLKHGALGACTIVEEDSYDTVYHSKIRIIDDHTIEGYRISVGWTKEQHVYFHAEFSKPFIFTEGFCNRNECNPDSEIAGTDIRAILTFDLDEGEMLQVKAGISSASCAGARKNLDAEIPDWDFEKIKNEAGTLWNKELARFRIKTKDPLKKELFYTCVYNVSVYPMQYSDIDGNFRGPDHKIHNVTDFRYFGGVIGLWDTFRASIPLLTLVRPDIMSEYYKTFLGHYKYFGELPVYVLAGEETFCMIGVHSIPVLADWYMKGLKNYNAEEAYDAMKVSLMRDTIGFTMRYFQGFLNYKKLGYVPADLEAEATARTLEYAYDDWCMAQMAKAMGKDEDYKYFSERALNYRNVFDKNAGFMNGRFVNGEFRPGLDPFHSRHRRDDFCEGNAWQWTFFVPHDIAGLGELLGGKDALITKLDSLFAVKSTLAGEQASGDITGLIGQYAHGNEPSHHIAYMYNYLGQPWKTQKFVNQILTTLYDNTENGICGDEDTGQMSAWYVFSSMGLYPMNPPSQRYDIGSPLFDEVSMTLGNGETFTVKTRNLSNKNIYIQSAKLNGKSLNEPYITYNDIIKGAKLEFIMGDQPNKNWGILQ